MLYTIVKIHSIAFNDDAKKGMYSMIKILPYERL